MPLSSDGVGVYQFLPTSGTAEALGMTDPAANAEAAVRYFTERPSPVRSRALCRRDLGYLAERVVADVENDRDVAGGHPLTGFELDAIEAFDRARSEVASRVEADLALYGEAYLLVGR